MQTLLFKTSDIYLFWEILMRQKAIILFGKIDTYLIELSIDWV